MLRKFLYVVSLQALVLPLTALGNPVSIKFVQPKQGPSYYWSLRRPPTVFQSGWPMTIELTMRNEDSIATTSGPPFFPNRGRTGYVIFDDPDGCIAMDSFVWPGLAVPEGCPSVRPPSDETFVEFTPDVDDVGLPDGIGNESRIQMLVDAFSAGQAIDATDFDGSPTTKTIGPRTSVFEPVFDDDGNEVGSEEIVDGYGFGADDDIVSLVVLAKHGAGILYEDNGLARQPLELRNLAGFTNSVGYELNNFYKRTTVSAHMVLPPGLIAPLVVVDQCVGDVSACEIQWRVDGAAARPADQVLGLPQGTVASTFASYTDLVDGTLYEITAMVVSGTAPDTVVDMNGNGRIEAWDLSLMGYTVLGRKRNLRVRQLRGDACNGGIQQIVYLDFDGNGEFDEDLVCPASPGGKSKVPR